MSELSERLHEFLSRELDAPLALTTEARSTIAELFAEASSEDLLAMAAVVDRLLQDQPGYLKALYARATAEELAGEKQAAGNLYLQLAQTLSTQKDWEGVLDLALHAMPLTGDYRLVRLVKRAGEQGGIDVGAALAVARQECQSSPDLLWEQSQQADANGARQEGLKLALSALEAYVAIKEPEQAEDPLLRVLESEDTLTYERLLVILKRMATGGHFDLLDMALELAEKRFLELGLADPLAEALTVIMERRPDDAELRSVYARAITQPMGDSENLSRLVKETGLDNPAMPLEDALTAFREAAAFSPGAYVSHRSWGVGIITRNEDDELTIDFEEKPRHRMALAMGKNVLLPLSKASLQVQRFTDLEGLKQEAETHPENIIYRLMMESGGEIVTADIKLRLTSWLVPEEKWAPWWKKARKAIEEDARIDTSQAFRHLYREAKRGSEADIPLLDLDPRKGIKGAMSLINKLLEQHPTVNERARAHYGPEIRRMLTASSKKEDAIRALPLLMRWYPDREAEWQSEAEKAIPSIPLTLAGEEEDQQILLDLGLKTRIWKDAAFSALASRFAAIKEKGLEVLGERARETLWEDFQDLLLGHGHFQQKMAVADMILNGELTRDDAEAELPVNPWYLLCAALSVAASKAAHAGRGTSNRLLRVSGPLTRWLKGRELNEEANACLNAFRRHPIEGEIQLQLAAFLSEIGQDQLAQEILAMNRAAPEEEHRPAELDPRVTLMTRATLEMQTERLREMEHLLAVDIPQEIAKARALGDLSENAEYHAARERQGITKALYDNLLAQIETAVAIEDLHRIPGIAGVGKLIKLRNRETGEENEVWVLGEGDSQYGHGVISYKAPLGQSLVGKRIGDAITLPGDGEQEWEIVQVEEKLP